MSTFLWGYVFGLDRWYVQMQIFMGGFFLTFSALKLLDVKGFATAYQTYDLLAKGSRVYALSYPFIELLLGVAFLFSFQLRVVSILTFVIMEFSAVSVLKALAPKQRFQCACLVQSLRFP